MIIFSNEQAIPRKNTVVDKRPRVAKISTNTSLRVKMLMKGGLESYISASNTRLCLINLMPYLVVKVELRAMTIKDLSRSEVFSSIPIRPGPQSLECTICSFTGRLRNSQRAKRVVLTCTRAFGEHMLSIKELAVVLTTASEAFDSWLTSTAAQS